MLLLVGIGPRRPASTSNRGWGGTCGTTSTTARASAMTFVGGVYAPCPPPRPSAMATPMVSGPEIKRVIRP